MNPYIPHSISSLPPRDLSARGPATLILLRVTSIMIDMLGLVFSVFIIVAADIIREDHKDSVWTAVGAFVLLTVSAAGAYSAFWRPACGRMLIAISCLWLLELPLAGKIIGVIGLLSIFRRADLFGRNAITRRSIRSELQRRKVNDELPVKT